MWLARSQILVSIFVSVVELQKQQCEPQCISAPEIGRYCSYQRTIGQGIWLSIFPFIAGIFGIYASSKTATKVQIRLLMGFSIVGAVMMVIMVLIEASLIHHFLPGSFRTLQIMMCCVGAVNAILLVASASMSCGLCCNGQRQQSNDVMYVAYTPAVANYPLQTSQPGMIASPQMVAMTPARQMMTMAPNSQMMTMAPNSQMMTMAPNSQMMTMAVPNPPMMAMNAPQMQQFGFAQQGYPIMFAQSQLQQVTPQQIQPNSSTPPELPEYQAIETKTVPQSNDS